MLSANELNWSLRRGVDARAAAESFANVATEIRSFLGDVEAKRASGTGSRWSEIEDAMNRLEPPAYQLAVETFLDSDVAVWLIQQESHVRDAANYMRYLENIAERATEIA